MILYRTISMKNNSTNELHCASRQAMKEEGMNR
jgi:hypothetical protein